MAKGTKHLPIYVASKNLMQEVTSAVKDFPRNFRPTLGAMIMGEALELLLYIYRANAAQDKTPHITQALEKAQVTETLMQLAFDLKLVSPEIYITCIDLTEYIGRQGGGWRKSSAAANIRTDNHPCSPQPVLRVSRCAQPSF